MSKNPGRSAWAEQAQKQLREQREKEMPGMQVAKQQATQDTKDGKAEKAAQRKEALQLREAKEVRGVQESLQTLALDPLLSAKAREWSDNGALMEKLITCANQMGAKLKRANLQLWRVSSHVSIPEPCWCLRAAEKWGQMEGCRRHQHQRTAKTKWCPSLRCPAGALTS